MATTASILSAAICILAIVYAFLAYKDTRRYHDKLKKEQRSKSKSKYRR